MRKAKNEANTQTFGDKDLGGRVRGRRLAYSRQETLPRGRPKHVEQLFQGEDAIAASDIEHCRSTAQLALTVSPQPTNSHRGQPLSSLQAIDLGGIEGQAGQSRASQRRCEIASPALLLEPPALFEFAIRIILNVPAWTKRLQSRKAIGEAACTH